MGEILIFGIPSRNLKQLELSGNIYPSPRPSAHPLSLSRHAAQALSFTAPLRSLIAPTKSCSIFNSTSQNTPHTRVQPPYTLGIDYSSTMSHSPSQTSHDSGRESVAGVESNTMNPFLPFTSIDRPSKEVKLPASGSQPAQMTVYSPDAYLHYAPIPSDRSVSYKYRSYKYCLCKLGFKPEEVELGIENRLIKDLKAYLDGTEYFYLRECDNPAAFKTLVLEFLEETGPRYWGHSQRQRLAEKEPSKGYLYPRDIQRGKTAFLDAIETLFNYKAACSHTTDRKKPTEKQVHRYIDYAAMTGRKVDAKALADVKKNRQTVTSESEDDNDLPWNVFDQVETETVLRPNPVRTKWTRELPDGTEALNDHVQYHEKPVKRNKHSQRRDSSVDPGTSQKRRKTQGLNTGTLKKLSIDSSTDSDVPLLHKAARKHRPSPPVTRDQSLATVHMATPALSRVSKPSFISLISDSDEETPQTIKTEPLSASARAGTLLKVSMHNQPEKLEISVPLGTCQTSNQLFDKLTTEWRLRPEMANKVNFISARYRWSGEPHGMRRGESLDWELFCATIREAWDKKEGGIKDVYIVEMKLIADD